MLRWINPARRRLQSPSVSKNSTFPAHRLGAFHILISLYGIRCRLTSDWKNRLMELRRCRRAARTGINFWLTRAYPAPSMQRFKSGKAVPNINVHQYLYNTYAGLPNISVKIVTSNSMSLFWPVPPGPAVLMVFLRFFHLKISLPLQIRNSVASRKITCQLNIIHPVTQLSKRVS